MSGKYSDAQKAAYYKKKYIAESKKKKSSAPRRKNYSRRKYDYPGAGQAIGSLAGNYLAPGIGGAIGGAVGNLAQYGIKSITGFGDYTVRSNAILFNKDAVPMFTHTNPRCTVISHREFIKDIRSSTGFESSIFNINPGDPMTFPWLSQIAANYEEYIFQGIVFEFKTNSATAVSSTNTALGTVCMATQYNSLAPDFTSKHQIENYEFANSAVPCESFMHAIECDPTLGNEVKYVFNERDSDLNADPRNYNLGKTTIATQGMQAASTIGELWVTYKVCMMKPRLGYNQSIMDVFRLELPTITPSFPLGPTILDPSLKNMGIVSQIPSGSLNVFEVFEGFNGVLRCEVNYDIVTYTTLKLPYWSIPAASVGVITDVTSNYVGYNSTDQIELNSTVKSLAGTAIAYFQFLGGFDTTGNPPRIDLIAMAGSGIDVKSVYVDFSSVPSQSVLPEF